MANFLEVLKAILFGIVEGITEWLPISSTGHMILLDEFVRLQVSQDFWDLFLVVIQLGAILAVVVIYWNRLWPFYNRPLTAREKKELPKMSKPKQVFATVLWRYFDPDKWRLWSKVLVGCLPVIIVALPFDDVIEEKLNNYVVVAICLIVYGVVFILVERFNSIRPHIRKVTHIDYWTALIIGCFQVLSLIPGTSRSGATILGALLAGCTRPVAAEFTFFMAVPVMLGASLLKLVKFGFAFNGFELLLLIVGMVVAFIVSIIAIRKFMSYIRRHDFRAFGIYRIILGVVVLLYFVIRQHFFA